MKICKSCNTTFKVDCKTCAFCKRKVKDIKLDDRSLKKFLGVDQETLNRFKKIRKDTIAEARKYAKKGRKIRVIGLSGTARSIHETAKEESNTEFLLQVALDEMKKLGASTELIKLRNYNIQHCEACYSTANAHCHFPCSCYPAGTPMGDDMSNILYDKVLPADIILFATPVNNFKMSTHMCTFIDRCISLDGSLAPANLINPKDKELNIKHTKFIEAMSDQKIPGSGFMRRFMGKVAGIIVTGHEEGATMVITNLFMTLNHFGMAFPSWSNMYAMSSILNPTCADRAIVRGEGYQEEARTIARNTFALAKLMRKKKVTDWEHDYSSN